MRILLLSILFFSFYANSEPNNLFSRRYITPKDEHVIKLFNEHSATKKINPNNFNILVWNVYKGLNKDFHKDFSHLSQDQDIVILQEAHLDTNFNQIFNYSTDFSFVFATAWIDIKYKTSVSSGVMTGSIQKPEIYQWQRSYYLEPIIRTPKMALFSKYYLEDIDKVLMVGNIHAINFVTTKKFRHMIRNAVKELAAHNGPIIFAGDFNTWSKRKTHFLKSEMKRLGFTEVVFEQDYRKRFLGNILDYVFVKGLKVNHSIAPVSNGSDHNPMLVNLSVL